MEIFSEGLKYDQSKTADMEYMREYWRQTDEKVAFINSMSKEICKLTQEETLQKVVQKIEKIVKQNEQLRIQIDKYEQEETK